MPVSYTHLDVYKRQVMGLANSETVWAIGTSKKKVSKEINIYASVVLG